jgi:hypothetical protein
LQSKVDQLQSLVDEFHPVFEIGDVGPAGGIVFHLTDDGIHGLEAAPKDQPSGVWGCFEIDFAGADGLAVGDAAQNTADILAGCNEVGIAAKIAADYTLNGYTDWFLPSIFELVLLRAIGIVKEDRYWSSTEESRGKAWALLFGLRFSIKKDSSMILRPIRAF